jgi:hypothetical protein
MKRVKDRLIDQLLEKLESSDCLKVSGLSRLGCSVSQSIMIIDTMIEKKVGAKISMVSTSTLSAKGISAGVWRSFATA